MNDINGYCIKCLKIVNIIKPVKKKMNSGKIVYEGSCEVCSGFIRKKEK